ncbi:MAG: hypothetical protein LC789_13995 [Actinobacteria bacterium]|nr:hypothetical protein [Actinomycetota bacterium]MCA1720778.1 hypothetical protein [Actinomycetota bacterium]
MKLDDLDDKLVPRAAEKLRDLLDRTGDGRSKVTGALLEPSPRSPLRRLDDRYASSGPLALLRDVPQLGLLLVAAVFLAGAAVALARSGGQQRQATAQQQIDATTPTALGPEIGTSVAAYVDGVRKRAVLVSQTSPGTTYTAYVTFSKYLTPEQVRAALGELQVNKVVVHAKLPVADVLPVAVTDLVPDAKKLFADLARKKATEAKEFTSLASSITGQSKDEQQFKAFYTSAAVQAARERKVYSGSCACLIAALVRGTAAELAALPAVSGIRAVELGGRVADDSLLIRPLAPEQTGTVTKIATPTGGNGA